MENGLGKHYSMFSAVVIFVLDRCLVDTLNYQGWIIDKDT